MLRKWIWTDDFYADGNEMGGQGVLDLFISGRLAMMEMGPWNLDPVMTGAKFNWDVAPFPNGPAGPTCHQSVDGSFIWSKTKHPQESWALLKGTTSPEYGKLLIQYDTKQPSRKSLLADFAPILRQTNPKYKNINLNAFTDSIKLDIGGPEEMFHNDDVCKNTILQPAFDQVFLLGKAPVSIIGQAGALCEQFNTGKLGIADIGGALNKLGITTKKK